MLALTANGKPITREQAQQKAAAFLLKKNDSRKLAPVVNATRLAPRRSAQNTSLTQEPYFVFDRGTNEGYVIVSGDDQTIDVLGYCEEGSFNYEQLPPQLQDLLAVYTQQIEAIQNGAAVQRAPATHSKVETFMDCKWSQGSPYNNLCPLDAGSRSVTGCVATAMAQILYYNRDKSVTETQAAIPGYSTYTKGIAVSGIAAGAPIDWENMKATYGSSNDLQKTAVAQLMLYCGVSVHMDYTNSSSGAQISEVVDACKKYFGYGSSVKMLYNSDYSEDEWDRVVYAELAAGRPVYLGGYNADAGHAFLTCGYENKRYWINWGWGGQSDGYYYLTNLTPGDGQGIGGSSDGYNAGRTAIIGLEPENFGEKAMTFKDATVMEICVANWDKDADGTFTYAEAATVTDLGTVFQGKTITSFPELYYFTSLTAIDDDAFNGCSSLTTMRLPKALKTIGARSFKNCAALRQIDLPTGVTAIGEEAFAGCKILSGIELPVEIATIAKGTFKDCAAFTYINLPLSVTALGDEAFNGCSKLTGFKVGTFHPENIELGTSVFGNINLSQTTLIVPQGLKSYYAVTDQWKDFGNIQEYRERSAGNFATLEVGKTYYIYNVGTGKYLTKGEAYGTQAIVGNEPMRFVVRKTGDFYYLTSPDTGKTGTYLFRTTTDSNVGSGVKACFVDGSSLTATAYWTIAAEADNAMIYTIQVPSTQSAYVAGQYLGVQTDHQSGAASPTYGAYFDISYAEHKMNCQWQLVLYNEDDAAVYAAAEVLQNLIDIAAAYGVSATAEEAVCNNFESTIEELKAAQRSLRKKLKFIDFDTDLMREICVANYDSDLNGEVSIKEALAVTDLGYSFYFAGQTSLTSADELQYFSNATALYGATFNGCTNLESVILPAALQQMYYNAFMNCKSLKKITLPETLRTIGNNCFRGCTSLTEVTVESPDPSTISLGSYVFTSVDLANCTLKVPFGSKALYEKADVWKDFGTIVEVRTKTAPAYSKLVTNEDLYLYNIGTRMKVTMGEAYGTQSVVGRTGRLYQLKRSSNMDQGVYYLSDVSTGKVVFRVSTDSKVGDGVKTCFGDGSLTERAYWQIDSVGVGLYALHIPATHDDYVANEYLGTDDNHQSAAASPTNGLYYDIKGVTAYSTWAFITKEAADAAVATDAIAADLAAMIALAQSKGIDTTAEEAVYNNAESTDADLREAARSLRDKMELISFDDDAAKTICVNKWDSDADGELSLTEAAAVTTIEESFRGSAIKHFDELRYFTSLTTIPENAFYDCSKLYNIYVPEGVKTIERYAFSNCSNLRYVALLNGTELIPATLNGLTSKASLFVKANLLESYQNDADWKSKSVSFLEYTGTPVVTAEATRQYAYTTAVINVLVKGAPINGEPEYSCEAIADGTKDAGEYPIVITPGTITTHGLVCQEGVLTITQRKARITAKSYSRAVGQENPVFEIDKVSGLKNDDTAETIFLVQPVFTCEATIDSPVGKYDIVPSGAEAKNYYFEYKNGTLTITEADPDGIETITVDEAKGKVLFDLQGRRVTSPKRGIYVVGNTKKKVMIK